MQHMKSDRRLASLCASRTFSRSDGYVLANEWASVYCLSIVVNHRFDFHRLVLARCAATNRWTVQSSSPNVHCPSITAHESWRVSRGPSGTNNPSSDIHSHCAISLSNEKANSRWKTRRMPSPWFTHTHMEDKCRHLREIKDNDASTIYLNETCQL